MRFVCWKPNSISLVKSMDNSLLAATIFAAAVGAQIEMYGMLAENERRKLLGADPAYTVDDFFILKDGMENRIAKAYQ